MKIIRLFKNDTTLIAQAARGDRGAQHRLYQAFSPKMLGVCRLYIKDAYQAEEAMLNGFFKVFKNLKSFDDRGSFEGWIRRIMIRECLNFLRQGKKVFFEPLDKLPETPSSDDLPHPLQTEHIQQLIDELPDGYRTVFVLHAIEGYKHSEIAEMLNIEAGTSKSQLAKARKLLQARLRVDEVGEKVKG